MNTITERLRGRRGVALPVALVGLVAVSLLATSALLTSTTESAISAAQADGARALYNAEGGLGEHLRLRALAGGALPVGVTTVTLPESGTQVQITTSILSAPTPALTALNSTRTVSLMAEPMVNGQTMGRAVVALVTQQANYSTMSLNVNEGAVVGSDLQVGGNSKVIDNSTICADTVGAGAVKHSSDATVSENGSGDIQGEVTASTNAGQAFIDEILGGNGNSLMTFANLADIKFGPRFGQADFPSNGKPAYNSSTAKLRWGCPTQMGMTCNTADTAYYPIIAIDAKGGAVDLQGDHGQGILVVVNGSLKISGNFLFKGIMLIEGYIDMTGTGGRTGSKLEGSVIAFGEGTTQSSRVDESQTHGNAVISYNRCEVRKAQESFNRRSRQFPTFQTPSTTFGWYEVVR